MNGIVFFDIGLIIMGLPVLYLYLRDSNKPNEASDSENAQKSQSGKLPEWLNVTGEVVGITVGLLLVLISLALVCYAFWNGKPGWSLIQTIEATPGIEIQGNRLPISHLASNSHSVTQLQRPKPRLSPYFSLIYHGVVPNSYQVEPLRKFGLLIACEIMTRWMLKTSSRIRNFCCTPLRY